MHELVLHMHLLPKRLILDMLENTMGYLEGKLTC